MMANVMARLLTRFRPVRPEPPPDPRQVWRQRMQANGWIEWCNRAPPDGIVVDIVRMEWDRPQAGSAPLRNPYMNTAGLFWRRWDGVMIEHVDNSGVDA